jgi:type IX secretion system PorP/SprF family membrane protein
MRLFFSKTFFLILTLPFISKINAQQDPRYSQFMHNKLNFNAGFAGATDGKINATFIYRQGLTSTIEANGFEPTNLVGSINAKIGSRLGIGATFASDKLGFETMTMPRLTLAYRQPLGNAGVLAAGVGIGFMRRSLDGSKLNLPGPLPGSPTSKVTGTAPDVDFGLFYTKDNLFGMVQNFYAGLSATHINQNKITYEGVNYKTTIDSKIHTYFLTGGEFQLNSTFKLQPNILLKKDLVKIQAVWNKSIRGGVTYRPKEAMVLLVGYEFPFGLNIGYSYDIATSKTINYIVGSHEIMISYCYRKGS